MNYSELVRNMVCPIIIYCDDIEVTEKDFAHCLHITLRVNQADHSKVVGAMGRMVQAITLLIVQAGANSSQPIHFELLEPTHGEREPEPPFEPDLKWNDDKTAKLVRMIQLIANGVFVTSGRVFMATSGKNSTNIEFVNPLEPAVAGALSTLFRAIGKNNGRNLLLNSKKPKQ